MLNFSLQHFAEGIGMARFEDVFLFCKRSILHLTSTISKPWLSSKSLRRLVNSQHFISKKVNTLMTKAITNKPLFFNENSSQPPEVLEGFFSNCRTSFQTSPDHQSSLFFAINFQALDSYIMCFCIPAIGGSLCSVWGTQPKNGCSACSRQPQRVEAEATSLTTYRQNIGILDVGGKPRGKKKQPRGGWGGCDSDMIRICY